MDSQKAWNVFRVTSLARSPTVFTTRAFISPAALSVNVKPRMFSPERLGSDCSRWRMRSVITRVFPVPAPAITRSGPSPWVIARRWASLSCRPASASGSRSKSVRIVDKGRGVKGNGLQGDGEAKLSAYLFGRTGRIWGRRILTGSRKIAAAGTDLIALVVGNFDADAVILAV